MIHVQREMATKRLSILTGAMFTLLLASCSTEATIDLPADSSLSAAAVVDTSGMLAAVETSDTAATATTDVVTPDEPVAAVTPAATPGAEASKPVTGKTPATDAAKPTARVTPAAKPTAPVTPAAKPTPTVKTTPPISETRPTPPAPKPAPTTTAPEQKPAPAATGGASAIFTAYKCASCHSIESKGITSKAADVGGDLSKAKHDAGWIARWLQKKEDLDGTKHMKKFAGTDAELTALSAWLAAMR